MRRIVYAGWLVAATMFATSARADDEPPPSPPAYAPPPPLSQAAAPMAPTPPIPTSPYRLRIGLEIPIIAVAGATLMTALVPTTPAPCLPNCPVPDTMNWLDRQALGANADGAGIVADLALAAIILVPHLTSLVVTRNKDNAWLEDVVVSAEATLLATGVSQVLKTGMRRYSPRVYDGSLTIEQRSHPESTRSFWSSHTATATAAATSFAVSYWLRHPGSPWRWAVLGGLEATALTVGLMTILAGWHFPTDVGAGALAGVASGVAVPMMHTVW